MAGIGAELPPHLLAKRKRKQEEEAEDAPTTASGAKHSSSPGEGEKRRKVIGPAMPPAPLEERPEEPPNAIEESDSDGDDGFGPALPTTDQGAETEGPNSNGGAEYAHAEANTTEDRPKRDDWMMMPPKQDDLAARMDPTKQRARGFATGKGARGPNHQAEDSSIWHETPEQKQKRLADEMMGVSKPQTGEQPKQTQRSDTGRDEAAARSIREHAEKSRGPSLLDQHKQSTGKEAEDDDPSKRSFDREKDMGSGMRIGHTQRQQMLNKASDFSSKFAKGSYL